MIRVGAPSRLHFGLFNPGSAEGLTRRFGGVGLMVEAPGVRVRVEPAADWSAEGPLAERALVFAHRVAASLTGENNDPLYPQRVTVEEAAAEHAGLGTGTQLGLAVARALAISAGRDDLSAAELARHVGRGRRSALGVHGFERGGFLVEAGQRAKGELSPLVACADVPRAWRVVLALPRGEPGLHGAGEGEAFRRLEARPVSLSHTERLCRLVLLGMLPALVEDDLDAFGEAVYEFNRTVGESFAPVQGGVYAGSAVAALVDFLRGQGAKGVGQSSWGPTVFALAPNEERAAALAAGLQ